MAEKKLDLIKAEPIEEVMSQYLTYSGKPIEKMSWLELKREKRLQKWFARRCNRMCWAIEWGNTQRRKELEEKTSVEEAEAAYKRGEITDEQLMRIRNGRKRSFTMYQQAEESLEFLKMHMYQAEAIQRGCAERMQIVNKPKKRKQTYNPRMRGSRRKNQNLNPKGRAVRHNFAKWQAAIEKRGIGALWDRDKFLLVCADRGYGSMISVYHFLGELFDYSQYQSRMMLHYGQFTWGQVLALGASLEMTPKEFADTFMAGYFVEYSEGDFHASYDNLPDDVINKPDD